MKRFAMILGLLILVLAMAAPVFASTPPCGGVYGPGYYKGYGDLSPSQQSKLDHLNQKFYDESTKLQNDIWAKSSQLNTLLNSSNHDSQKVKALQKDITALKGELAERRSQYNLDARKIDPEARYSVDARPGYGPTYHWDY